MPRRERWSGVVHVRNGHRARIGDATSVAPEDRTEVIDGQGSIFAAAFMEHDLRTGTLRIGGDHAYTEAQWHSTFAAPAASRGVRPGGVCCDGSYRWSRSGREGKS